MRHSVHYSICTMCGNSWGLATEPPTTKGTDVIVHRGTFCANGLSFRPPLQYVSYLASSYCLHSMRNRRKSKIYQVDRYLRKPTRTSHNRGLLTSLTDSMWSQGGGGCCYHWYWTTYDLIAPTETTLGRK